MRPRLTIGYLGGSRRAWRRVLHESDLALLLLLLLWLFPALGGESRTARVTKTPNRLEPPGQPPGGFFSPGGRRRGNRGPTMDGAHHMRYMTDDLRIREINELAPPAHLIREFPCTDRASITVHESARRSIASCTAWTTGWSSSSARARSTTVGPRCDYAARLKAERERFADRSRDRDARLLREAAHHRRLEGADQRPATSTAASTSTTACASRASCCWRSTTAGPAGAAANTST